ncbi:fluoride efflux transporter FluC [Nocardioides donggukensis]|uniref:Fluoride-specific ion channel FluC n=1 Tax=Nocardioides donggukensis TaxID=2774019 RepID=A0A927Q0D1_9ACTN|nr:CrcB family protein [Nocardioides donggukensis]MBD8868289.1 CrcB family protein [Nocardioides donggukensis]
MTALLVALGAAVGAPLRYLAGHHLDRAVPWGTFAVNVAGSFLLGAFTASALSGAALALLGTGFCGALTTYSAFAVRAVELGGLRSLGYAGGTIVLALAACAAGFVLVAGQP